MLPAEFRYELSAYDLQLYDLPIKARVVTEADVLVIGIADLRSRLGQFPVVGFDLRTNVDQETGWNRGPYYETLVLSVKHLCLIIQLEIIGRRDELSHLWNFLGDTSICFVGVEMNMKIKKLRGCKWWKEYRNSACPEQTILETGTDISDFVGTVVRYAEARSRPCPLDEIVDNLEEVTNWNNSSDWAKLTSYSPAEDIKMAVHEASTCNKIAYIMLMDTFNII